jgi:hypothetical protein
MALSIEPRHQASLSQNWTPEHHYWVVFAQRMLYHNSANCRTKGVMAAKSVKGVFGIYWDIVYIFK